MKKFLLVIRQSSGCDYTIGCGVSVYEMSAESMKEAIVRATGMSNDWKSEIEDYDEDDLYDWQRETLLHDLESENDIISIDLIEVGEEVDLIPILEKWKKEVDEFKEQKKEAAEKELYNKLHKKYGRK